MICEDNMDNDDDYCSSCDGTGEGQWDGLSCSTCKGKGYLVGQDDDDFDVPDDFDSDYIGPL
jgi:DnaJ-class molecular chaperone